MLISEITPNTLYDIYAKVPEELRARRDLFCVTDHRTFAKLKSFKNYDGSPLLQFEPLTEAWFLFGCEIYAVFTHEACFLVFVPLPHYTKVFGVQDTSDGSWAKGPTGVVYTFVHYAAASVQAEELTEIMKGSGHVHVPKVMPTFGMTHSKVRCAVCGAFLDATHSPVYCEEHK
jgi:hypothetical protein